MAQGALYLDDIYQREICPLSLRDRLMLAQRIIAEAAAAARRETPRSLLELEGLGTEIWQGVDAQTYVDELRAEWDERPAPKCQALCKGAFPGLVVGGYGRVRREASGEVGATGITKRPESGTDEKRNP